MILYKQVKGRVKQKGLNHRLPITDLVQVIKNSFACIDTFYYNHFFRIVNENP